MHHANHLLQSKLLCQSCCSTSRASNSPDPSRPLRRVPAPRSQLRLHGVIFMHHRDAGADECQQYARGSSRSRRAPLLHQITIMSCSTRFHLAPTRSTALVWVLMEVPKRCFIAWCCTLLFVSGWRGGCLLYFCFSLAAETQFLDRTGQVYGCAGHRVKP